MAKNKRPSRRRLQAGTVVTVDISEDRWGYATVVEDHEGEVDVWSGTGVRRIPSRLLTAWVPLKRQGEIGEIVDVPVRRYRYRGGRWRAEDAIGMFRRVPKTPPAPEEAREGP
jgi:hypothetical protein